MTCKDCDIPLIWWTKINYTKQIGEKLQSSHVINDLKIKILVKH